MSISLFKRLFDPFDDLNDVSPDPTDVFLDPNQDELFEQLKSKVVGLDLLRLLTMIFLCLLNSEN